MIYSKMTIAVIFSFCFIFGLMIVYLSKERVKNSENKIYKSLIILNLMGLVLHILCENAAYYYDVIPKVISTVIFKSFLGYFYAFGAVLLMYLLTISQVKNSELYKKIVSGSISVIYIILYFLPQELYRDFENKIFYTKGIDVQLIYVLSAIVITIIFTLLIKERKQITKKKVIPILIFMIGATISVIIQKFYPEIVVIDCVESIIILLMYFTIENPDMKVLNELYKNKTIMEQTYDDKANFLFEAAQEIKYPLLNITNICNETKDEQDTKKIKENLNHIRLYSKQLDFILNEVLDVSGLSSQTIKFIDNKYNLNRLYDEIVSRVNAILPRTVKFNSKKPYEIPILYGDSIKLKQVITSILQNSVKHTKSGFIDFNIDTIERFDAIRLIITIRDSSEGLPIDKINEILTITGNLDVQDVKDLEQNEINLKLCSKIMKLMGGNMMIRSEEGRGIEILLIIDQKIADIKDYQKSNIYENIGKEHKNIIIVNQDKDIEEILKNKLKERKITYSYLLDGNDLIDRIKSKREYDYIIIGDELKGINGISILRELQKKEDFKTPIIIIVDKNKENLAKHYLEQGFDNYILYSNFEEDLNKVLDTY